MRHRGLSGRALISHSSPLRILCGAPYQACCPYYGCPPLNSLARHWILIATLFAFLAVAAGAFGAHGLKGRLSDEHLAVFETAARYQMYHALALGLTALWMDRSGSVRLLRVAAWCFAIGVVLFSGSLYALALSGLARLGAITPAGGLAFLAGWAVLAMHTFACRKSRPE